ncbi:hypothetical protein PVAND_017061 [Polypedilum vanderplanki]|uniref:Peptidase S1 domain-containing protein n=1 Tax=Polypedilum vanderplanki TaxID=319348 RepID=A0A9J6BIA1_POLVA|nr:hypothetical protein PVAND_017061 [Polypedilum vanderplanki]
MLKLLIFSLILNLYQVNSLQKRFPFDDNLCGIMSESAGLIHGGKLSKKAQFPWMAIISTENLGIWSHYGSGSLISHKHVLAYAGSVSYHDNSNKLIPVSVDRIKIYLGAIEYEKLDEPGSLKVGVEKISNHPFVRKVLPSLYVHQISILTLDQDVIFTQFIRPVCLWPFKSDLSEIVGKEAYAVGYGRDETGKDSLIRKHVRLTIQENCDNFFERELKFQNETELFCAKGNENEGPCMYDSQLYMKIEQNWFIKGISSTIETLENETCNMNRQTLYEDIEQHVPAIQLLMLE